MSAWDEAAVRADLWQRFHIAEGLTAGHAEALADVALAALAPHLAARDAETWAQACRAIAREMAAEGYSRAAAIAQDSPPPPKATL